MGTAQDTQDAVHLQPQIVVQPARGVLVDHEELAPAGAQRHGRPAGSGVRLEQPLGAVVGKADLSGPAWQVS